MFCLFSFLFFFALDGGRGSVLIIWLNVFFVEILVYGECGE